MNQDPKPRKRYYKRNTKGEYKGKTTDGTTTLENPSATKLTKDSKRQSKRTSLADQPTKISPMRQQHIDQCEYQLGKQFKVYKQNKNYTQFGFVPNNGIQQDNYSKIKFFVNVPREYPDRPIKVTSNEQDDRIMQHKLYLFNAQVKDGEWVQEPLLAKLNLLLAYMNNDFVSTNMQGKLIDSQNLTKVFYQQLQ